MTEGTAVVLAVSAAFVLLCGVVLWRLMSARRSATRRAALPSAAGPPPPTPPSSYERLRRALAHTQERLAAWRPGGADYEDLESALLTADVGLAMTERLVRAVASSGGKESAHAGLEREIVAIFSAVSAPSPTECPRERPYVIMVVGVNGVGKTTSIGKLAHRYTSRGLTTLLIAGDTFRAAAIDQLAIWAERAKAALVRQQTGGDPGAVVYDGMRAAVARQADVVIVDTAGRLHTKSNLMEELRKVRRIIAREVPGAPHETLLVLDAVTGQNGLLQARSFLEQIAVTGVVLTKLDGTAKGGIAIAIAGELGIPIRYVGLGEGLDDLREFDAPEFAAALLGRTGSELLDSGQQPPVISSQG